MNKSIKNWNPLKGLHGLIQFRIRARELELLSKNGNSHPELEANEPHPYEGRGEPEYDARTDDEIPF